MTFLDRSSQSPASDAHVVHIRVRVKAVAEVVDTDAMAWPAWPQLPEDELGTIRRAQPADFLLPIARRWLASLPSAVRPRALAKHYPRLANRLADAWADDKSVALVFDDLLIDHRGGRRGFPGAVKVELHRLWKHWMGERAESLRA